MWGAHATVINFTLYVCGGECPNDPRHKYIVYKYELDKNQWSALPHLQQYWGIPVSIDGQLAVIGGYHFTTHKATKLITTYTDSTWTDIYPNLLVARVEPAVVPHHQYVIVAGGISDDDNVLDSIEIFNIKESHWMIVNTPLPEPMYGVPATICGKSFTIVGYGDAENKRSRATFTISVDELISQQQSQQSLTGSTGKDKWHQMTAAPYWKTALISNTSTPIIIGGSDKEENTINDIILYDDTNNSWKKVSSLPINCSWTTVAVINQSIIVLGGCSDTKTDETHNATSLSDVYVGQLMPCE